jgi:hypothetical protein
VIVVVLLGVVFEPAKLDAAAAFLCCAYCDVCYMLVLCCAVCVFCDPSFFPLVILMT